MRIPLFDRTLSLINRNGKLVIESGVMENEIKVETKYCVDIAVVDKAQK